MSNAYKRLNENLHHNSNKILDKNGKNLGLYSNSDGIRSSKALFWLESCILISISRDAKWKNFNDSRNKTVEEQNSFTDMGTSYK